MRTKIAVLAVGFLTALTLTACGTDTQTITFKEEMDDFCTTISEMDTSINSVDATSEDAVSLLLSYLDTLDAEFQDFATLDFPEEFDYLEALAAEAGEYMSEAVAHYHLAYSNSEVYAENTLEYAKQNYIRAYKRVQIIITFLHGEEPEDADLVLSTDAS